MINYKLNTIKTANFATKKIIKTFLSLQNLGYASTKQ